MEKKKLGFDDFFAAIDSTNGEFIRNLHQDFIENGCKVEVKEAKSGYLVSYSFNKKTIANYVFRKKGLIIRIYANHLSEYPELLDTMPDSMAKTVKDAPICKRLVNPEDCNPKCATGYDFYLHGERYQKCRSNAFMFLVCAENYPFIQAFVKQEVAACVRAK